MENQSIQVLFNVNIKAFEFEKLVQEYSSLSRIAHGTALFSAKDVQYTMSKLVNSETGYYSYNALVNELGEGDMEVGKKKVSGLIAKHVLHSRPPSKMAQDLDPFPDYKVITASGVPGLRAMEILLKNKQNQF